MLIPSSVLRGVADFAMKPGSFYIETVSCSDALTGVHFDRDPLTGQPRATASNGKTIIRAKWGEPGMAGGAGPGATVSADACREAAAAAKVAVLTEGDGTAELTAGDVSRPSGSYERPFPRTERALDLQGSHVVLLVNPLELIRALQGVVRITGMRANQGPTVTIYVPAREGRPVFVEGRGLEVEARAGVMPVVEPDVPKRIGSFRLASNTDKYGT